MTITWTGMMIGPDLDLGGAPLMRREFRLDAGHGAVVSALWHITAEGVFEASIGSTLVSDHVLSPGWSSYEWRLRYESFDVEHLLGGAGEVIVLGLALGNGWYRGRLGWNGKRSIYGSELGALAQLEIDFSDGHRQTVVTDESWAAGPSAVLANDLYDGQTIDARVGSDSWRRPEFAAEGWVGVHVLEFDPTVLTPHVGPPVRRQEEISPVRIWTGPSGATLVDFGQNVVGWVRVAVQGEAGHAITLRHAEVLEDGELGVRPLRSAQATDRFILSGGDDVFEPTFTVHGFRYVQVIGWPGELDREALTAIVVHSDLRRTGHFACSDDMLNQLHRNVVWGARGNFLDVPTDCPQRDERLGWTGDLAVFAPTAAFLFDVGDFLQDWLADLRAEQWVSHGRVPLVVPDVFKYDPLPAELGPPETVAIWSDVAVWVPWALWLAFADVQVLEDGFESMAAHVRRSSSLASDTGLWDQGSQLGDWLDPTAPPDRPDQAKADKGVVATCCLYRSARTTAEAATVLGRHREATEFTAVADRTRAAFRRHYVSEEGRIHSDAVTAYVLAICFGLLDEPLRGRAGDRLAELVAENGYHIATGFAGTPYVCDALTVTGHLDDAYRLLLQRECPSWLYPVTMGATTIWERWDSMLPDGSINSGDMTSFNHYAFGAVADWMHRVICGLTPLEPGYRSFRVAPQPGGGLSWAEASLDSPFGLIAVAWRLDAEGVIVVDVTVPDGATAEVVLLNEKPNVLSAGRHTVRQHVAQSSQ